MPVVLLLKSQPHTAITIKRNVMLLEHNICLIRNRNIQTNSNLEENELQQIEDFVKMTTPSTSSAKYKTSTDANKSSLDAATTFILQQQQQQQQHQQHFLMQQQMMQQNMLTAAAAAAAATSSTSPLQHLSNIFGFNFNGSPPPVMPPTSAVATTMPLTASALFQVNNNLQHVLAGVSPQQQQQLQQLYQEFYSNMLPQQHYAEQQMLRDLIQATSSAQTDILPVKSSSIKMETLQNEPQPSQHQLLPASTPLAMTNSLTPLETTFANITSVANATSDGGIDVALNHNDCGGNMASLERQHNESTHANQHQHQLHYQLFQQQQQQQQQQQPQQGNNKLPKALSTTTSHQITRAPISAAETTTGTTTTTPTPTSTIPSLCLATSNKTDLSEAGIKCDFGVAATHDGGGVDEGSTSTVDIRGNISSMTSLTPVNHIAPAETTTVKLVKKAMFGRVEPWVPTVMNSA
uniref:Uncharacterized protein n=1 Tax=Stomoxys calcitrans TaxID=35570 RepID=A0A1I8PQJ4_STOCA